MARASITKDGLELFFEYNDTMYKAIASTMKKFAVYGSANQA